MATISENSVNIDDADYIAGNSVNIKNDDYYWKLCK